MLEESLCDCEKNEKKTKKIFRNLLILDKICYTDICAQSVSDLARELKIHYRTAAALKEMARYEANS
jgi:hypothetical protein